MPRRREAPDPRVSPDERRTLTAIAPLRVTTERLVRRMHQQRGQVDERGVEVDTEQLMTVVLEAYRRGVTAMHQGLHRAEGIDHGLMDEALDFALRDLQAEHKGR
jgi:hypothetical protein